MEEAYIEAKKAYEIGEVPVGAVLVKDGEIVARGHNNKETLNDPTGHAEIITLRRAGKNLDSWRLLGCSLYVTLEPCAMCAGAIVNSRVEKLIIGTRDHKRGCCGSIMNLLENENFNHKTEVVIGIMEEETSTILSDFFKDLRIKKSELK